MEEIIKNIWGYLAGVLVFCFDHWTGFAAFSLFVLQAVYQLYRIKQVKQECSPKKED